MVTFIIIFLLGLTVLVLLDGYAQYLGRPQPTSWPKLLGWGLLIAIVLSALWGFALDAIATAVRLFP